MIQKIILPAKDFLKLPTFLQNNQEYDILLPVIVIFFNQNVHISLHITPSCTFFHRFEHGSIYLFVEFFSRSSVGVACYHHLRTYNHV